MRPARRVVLTSSFTLGTTLSLSAGSFDLSTNGDIVGGTAAGSGMVFQGGTLSGVTVFGAVDLTGSGERLHVNNGITLTGAGGTGSASMLVTGFDSRLYLSGRQKLDNAAISIGNASSYDFVFVHGAQTLGPHATLTHAGRFAALPIHSGATVVNQGTLTAGYTTGRLILESYGSFVNQGSIAVAQTLGPQAPLTHTGLFAALPVTGMLVNQGTITAGYTTGRFVLDELRQLCQPGFHRGLERRCVLWQQGQLHQRRRGCDLSRRQLRAVSRD